MCCCTQGLGYINKCPVSFIYHKLFPLKQSCRDVILCQLYLQLKWQSVLPFGEPRQWDLQAAFSFRALQWVNRACVCFALFFSLRGCYSSTWPLFFSFLFFWYEIKPVQLKSSLPLFSLSGVISTITRDMGLGCAYLIKLKVPCSMQTELVELS